MDFNCLKKGDQSASNFQDALNTMQVTEQILAYSLLKE